MTERRSDKRVAGDKQGIGMREDGKDTMTSESFGYTC